MTEYETALHITRNLYSQMNMNVPREVVSLSLGDATAQFFFINADIPGLSEPTKVISFCQLFRDKRYQVLMYWTRPSLNSASFTVYMVSKPNKPELSRLNNDAYDRMFSWAACGIGTIIIVSLMALTLTDFILIANGMTRVRFIRSMLMKAIATTFLYRFLY